MGQKLDLLSLTARGCRFLCGFKRVQSLSFPVLVDREVPKGAWRWEMRKPTPVPAALCGLSALIGASKKDDSCTFLAPQPSFRSTPRPLTYQDSVWILPDLWLMCASTVPVPSWTFLKCKAKPTNSS